MSISDSDIVPMTTLLRTQRSLIRSIKSIKSEVNRTLNENPSDFVAHKATGLLKTWKPLLSQLDDIVGQIIDNTDFTGKTHKQIEDEEAVLSKDLESLRLDYAFSEGKISELFARLLKPSTPRMSLNASICEDTALGHVKLPDIQVPKFDGKFENFTEWHGLFVATIDKHPTLSSAKKLYYLKNAMIDEAKYLLKDCTFDEGSYESALAHVVDRYDNKRVIIAKHFADLVDFPLITPMTLRESLDRINASMRGLKVCNMNVAMMSPLITFLIVRKLPEKLRIDWENSNYDYSTYPSFEPLDNFLRNRCFSLESLQGVASPIVAKSTLGEGKQKQKTSLAIVTKPRAAYASVVCNYCTRDHYIASCPDFLGKSVSERFAAAKEKLLCLNCLRQYHSTNECNSSKCRKCGKDHHTLLHREIISTADTLAPATQLPSTPKASLATLKPDHRFVLLPSAVVRVVVGNKTVLARLLLDTCAQADLVSESFVRRHKLTTQHQPSRIQGTTSGYLDVNSIVELKIESRVNNYTINVLADVVGQIPYKLPPNAFQLLEKVDLPAPLADSELDWPRVDILLGNTHSSRILLGSKRFVKDLCLEESQFGLIVSGPLGNTFDPRCCHLTTTVNDILAKFWEVEEVELPNSKQTDSEACESHFQSTYTRLEDGRFQVRLPFKHNTEPLANTYALARASLVRSEYRLDSATRQLYIDFMDQYKQLRHMEPIGIGSAKFLIPHLPIKKPDSSTTKLRVVFNASAKNASGTSLNEALLNGPVLQPELFDNILHFRKYCVAFSADVGMMYRQTQVHPEDRPYQSILWRSDQSKPIQAYQLTTLTYGTTPAAYLATKCLQVLSREVEAEYPDIAYAISSEFYMDDLLSGADSCEAAVAKNNLIFKTLASAQMPLRKYVSNSNEFISSLDPALVETLSPVSFASTGAAKILGLHWDPTADHFFIAVELAEIAEVTLTKRSVLSLASRIFDPLGLAAPVTVRFKILLQDLALDTEGWDDPISTKLDAEFRKLYKDLEHLPQFFVTRSYFLNPAQKADLIGFCDASNRAYGAVIYIRVPKGSSFHCTLVCAKTRVAPLKALSIPRLELSGASLLARLMERTYRDLQDVVANTYAFCDSTTVLGWLKGPASKYQTFVRNRVERINSTLDSCHWSYVKSKENPADLLSRGISAANLLENNFWLHGPTWLSTNFQFDTTAVQLPEQLPEVLPKKICSITAHSPKHTEDLITRFSNFERLIRIVAYLFVFARKVRKGQEYNCDSSQVAHNAVCRLSQLCFFSSDYQSLQAGQALPVKSTLSSLNPFLDKYQLLRVGGRLHHSRLSYDERHPIILHRRSMLAALITRSIHEKYYHATRAFTLAHMQSRYWLVSGASQLVKKVIHSCVWCTRLKGETHQQLMGQLPSDRVTVSRPFAATGVDFAGPFAIRCTKHRTVKYMKYYAAFFVCLATRAVHVETVSDLSTEMFIEALQRFCARRGSPHTLWTDNATNFVGARNRIAELYRLEWSFIPPRSPHHGGVWEAAIKAAKRLLVASTRNSVLTAEQLTTVLIKVEAILNSRPLYRRSGTADPDVIDVLTPGHFLIGSNLLMPAERNTANVSPQERLAIYGQIVSSFWSQWQRCYARLLQQRTKWKRASPNISVGDIVLIKEDSPPVQWPLARVVETFPDSSGQSRIVVVRASGTNFRRSVQQLVLLPVQ